VARAPAGVARVAHGHGDLGLPRRTRPDVEEHLPDRRRVPLASRLPTGLVTGVAHDDADTGEPFAVEGGEVRGRVDDRCGIETLATAEGRGTDGIRGTAREGGGEPIPVRLEGPDVAVDLAPRLGEQDVEDPRLVDRTRQGDET